MKNSNDLSLLCSKIEEIEKLEKLEMNEKM